jgi:acetyl/propionyl-CoA carboxylase alpha subunit
VYAEDPAQDFLPQAGKLLMYREPVGPGIRVDSGVVEGSEVSVFYDPMLAKLIVHAESRAAAIQRAITALQKFIVLGIRTNIPFLLRILDSAEFRDAAVHTGFLDAEGTRFRVREDTEVPDAVRAAVAFHEQTVGSASGAVTTARPADPFERVRGWSVR